jgi:hypothetical protein|tara:strand:- start:4421 stop:4849 length:429 start_codon:yes stop_codon:yes gene_type:complete
MRKMYLLVIPVGCFIFGILMQSQITSADLESTSPKQSLGSRTEVPDSALLFSQDDLHRGAIEKQALLQEELALYRLRQAQKQLLELSRQYPQTTAGKRAQEIIEREQFYPLSNYGFVPENQFLNGIPACRNSFRTAISDRKP